MNDAITDGLTINDTLGDLLKHPAFDGFSRLLLPWDDRRYDEATPLSDIGSLLPYHSHVDPTNVVAALNRMIDDTNKGHRIFFDFHSAGEKRANHSLQNTGLFFFRGRPGAPFALISPGGGFAYVGAIHEGFPYAVAISDEGYNAFVLKYRAGHGASIATEDLAAALAYIFENATMLGVSTAHYSVWGSSAGARMAAAIGSYGTAYFSAPDLPRPAAVVMAYTGHSDYSANEPATFVVVGERDAIAPPSTMRRRVAALRRAGTEVEYRDYPGLGHGFGVGVGTSAEGWITHAIQFWEKQMK
jgi:acetyl esterase/lipase